MIVGVPGHARQRVRRRRPRARRPGRAARAAVAPRGLGRPSCARPRPRGRTPCSPRSTRSPAGSTSRPMALATDAARSSGVPTLIKDNEAARRLPDVERVGCIADRAEPASSPWVDARARARPVAGREDDAVGVRAHRDDGDAAVRRDPKPVGHRPLSRRVERRVRGARGRGRRPAGARQRRRRLDPHPGVVLRARRAQADAGPAARPRVSPCPSTSPCRGAHPHRARHRALLRRGRARASGAGAPEIGHVEGPWAARLRVGVVTVPADGSARRPTRSWRSCATTAQLALGPRPRGRRGAAPGRRLLRAGLPALLGPARRSRPRRRAPRARRRFDPVARRAVHARARRGVAREQAARLPATLRRLRALARDHEACTAPATSCSRPCSAHEPPPLGHLGPDVDPRTHLLRVLRYVSFTPLQNVSGSPAISLPLGPSSNGRPDRRPGRGPFGQERRLLELAYELEAAAPFATL